MQPNSLRRLLERARYDEQAADLLLAHGGPDPVIGFLCLQAIEKPLKAVLVSKGLHAPKTHDLVYLVQLLEDAGERMPPTIADLGLLGPFAVDERYADTGAAGQLSMNDAREMLRSVRAWADARIT